MASVVVALLTRKSLPMFRYSLLLLPVLFFAACVNPPDFPDEPVITYVGISKNSIRQFNESNQVLDSIIIQFSFTDGDGDLSLRNDSFSDIFLNDSRLEALITPFNVPLIPTEGTGNGISGDIFITLINSSGVCCIRDRGNGLRDICFTDTSFPLDTFRYNIQIMDRAGNMSNIIQTEPIQIRCTGG